MSALIAIDPGIHNMGVAVSTGGVITDAVLVRGIQTSISKSNQNTVIAGYITKLTQEFYKLFHHFNNQSLIIEWPQIYLQSIKNGRDINPNNLLMLTAVAGAVITNWIGPIQFVTPHDWNHSRHKEATAFKVARRLSEPESLVIAKMEKKTPASLVHNVLDAVGINLHGLKRL
jgi:hypothetical protein